MSDTEKKTAKAPERDKLDLDPNAWEKFEALIKNAAKMGHKPHVPQDKRRKKDSQVSDK